VRVGHRQALNTKKPQSLTRLGFFFDWRKVRWLYTKDSGSILGRLGESELSCTRKTRDDF
jgi:hypothetical protein